MSRIESYPSSKAKTGNSVVKFLPTLPETRHKPGWQSTVSKRKIIPSKMTGGIGGSISLDDEQIKVEAVVPPSSTYTCGKTASIPNAKKPLSGPKRGREAFRQSLVGIIMQKEDTIKPPKFPSVTDNGSIPRSDSPKKAEKYILRYYYYIHHGIDTKNVAPMEDLWIKNVLMLVPESLKLNLDEVIDHLSDEVREDYLLSVKKAIVDFVLRDPREKEKSAADDEDTLPHRLELMQVPKPWEASFLSAIDSIQEKLYITNPTMASVLNLWYRNYGKLKLVDAADVETRTEAVDLAAFQGLLMQHIDSAKDTLIKKWFREVQNIFHMGNKKKLIPGTHQTKKLLAFFNSVGILMGNQLQSLALMSLDQYSEILNPSPDRVKAFGHPSFVIRLILDGTSVKFEPDFNDFEVILLSVFDVIVKAVSYIPCVETKLYTEWSSQKKYLKPNISINIINNLKENVKKIIMEQSVGPLNHATMYDKYEDLISKQAETDINEFLLQGRSFAEHMEEVKKYDKLVEEVTYDCQKVLNVGMFEIHCDELIRAISKRAENIRSKLLQNIMKEHQAANKILCDEYEKIAESVLAQKWTI